MSFGWVIQWEFSKDFTMFTAARFIFAFTIQISIHNTLLINTTFICIKYTRGGSVTREKNWENTREKADDDDVEDVDDVPKRWTNNSHYSK